ncbi:doubled CXXCH domain-containing protein [Bacillus sp. OV166]|uniref:cytochrome c3 family protein n=1 Tax=Bacillus sp. OV166 TaxID=1882763 RepID=UPI000A2AAE5C|nr:cytochrome c3 family protein [Bacillus sp. OV166]SMQ84261.1 doubled CXXCH domain-containing protein [Bacillus sp. OV166]
MKRKNYNRKLISYFVIWSVVLSSLLFSSPDNIVVSASAVPEIQMLTPDAGAVLNAPVVEFTGSISDDLTTPDKLSVKVFEQLESSQQPIDITDEGKLTLTPKENGADFSYSRDFSEGVHTITFVVTDEEGVSAKEERSFTVKLDGTVMTEDIPETADNGAGNPVTSTEEKGTIQETTPTSTEVTVSSQPANDEVRTRPYMAKMYLIPKDAADKYEPEKAVPSSFLPVEDMTRVPLNYVILVDVRSTEILTKSQPLLTSFGDIKGSEDLITTTVLTENLKSYVYTFTPDQNFKPSTSYYVYLNPKFSSETGNVIIPRFLKFTTVSDYKNTAYQVNRVDDETIDNDNIHGPFSVVTSACSFCHSTHNGTDEFLGKGSNENELCMACHDGTGSPKIEDNAAHSKHYKDSSVSCSSCHDPHNPGTKENPNSMHPSLGTDPFFNYKKASTAAGVESDYSLCFNCHTAGKAKDIKKYYADGTLKSQSGHNIQAQTESGISLNGQLPCAECHETHGASNIKMLRPELGNIKLGQKPESDQLDDNWFNKTTVEWDADAQRKFCLSCHNGQTDLYGKKGNAIYDKETGDPVNSENDGHDRESIKTCSECHSDSKSFMDTAHAPKRITP